LSIRAAGALVTVSFFAASGFSADPPFVFHDLIFPDSSTDLTAAYGVNDSGAVVGYYETNAGNEKRGFYGPTFAGGNLLPLNLGTGTCTPNSTVGVFPTSINNASTGNPNGTIVGTFSGTGCGTKDGFITSNDGATFTAFSPPTSSVPASYTLAGDFAAAINNSGVVVGYAIGQKGTSFPFDGYITTNATDQATYTSIIDPNATATGDTLPAGINASGQVVGLYVNNTTGDTTGFLLSGGTYYDVIVPVATGFTAAQGIDSNGDIVGFYKDATLLSHGFIWTGYTVNCTTICAVSGGTVTTLDDPNAGTNGVGGDGTQVLGISPDGKEIVGKYINMESIGTNGFYAMSSITTLTCSPTASCSPNPAAFGTSLTFKASVTPSSATGSVTFTIDGVSQTPVSLSGGAATFPTSTLSAGSHSVQATYSGNSNFGGSTSSTLTQTVSGASTTTAVTSSTNPSNFGQSVTFTATITPSPGNNGSITFVIDGTSEAPAALSSGRATFSISSLSVGSHTVRADYSGATNFAASSGSLSGGQSVVRANTTTGVSTSGSPSTYGTSVTFTATVTSSGGTPTGSVTFSVDSTQVQTVSLNGSGQAQYTTTTLTAGAHTILASYLGDTNFNTSSNSVSQTVNKASTTTSLTSSQNPSSSGQTVTFTAAITPSTVTGNVTFTIDSVAQSPVAISGGQAQLTTSSLSVNSHAVTAVYNGDSNYQASPVSNTVTQVVNPGGSLTLSSSLSPSTFGQSVTFTAILPGGTTGTITFAVDGIPQGSPVTITSNQAQFASASLAVGSRDISATYTPGNAVIVPATVHITQTVNKASTTTGLSSSAPSSAVGQSVTFTATITPSTATGQVAFSIDGGTITNVTIAGGQAQLPVSTLTAGSHSVQAVYSGDTNYNGSSNSFTQNVGKLASTTTLSSNAPSTYGQSLTFTATVTTGATGSVTFSVDGAPQQTVSLSGTQAQFVTATLAPGTHTILATYDGSASYASSNNSVTQTVNKAAGTVGLSSSTGSPSTLNQSVTFIATVPAGATGTITFTLDGGAGIGVAVANGQALFTPSTLSPGSHAITASYSGDANFNPGSGNFTQVVSQLPVGTVTLSSSSNPATFGLVVIFAATVPAGATGTITFTIDGAAQAPIILTGAQAQFAISNLSAGSHSVTATYSGNANFLGSTSSILTEVINQGLGSVGISASPSPSTVGQAVTFLATVPAGATGTITFSVDGAVASTQPVVGGLASFSTSMLTTGNHTIAVAYSGDSHFAAGSNSVVQVVNTPAPALLSLTSSENPSVVGQSVTFTVAVSNAAVAAAVNGVPVVFYDGTTQLGISTAQNGQAALTTSALLAGSHTISAQVPGTAVRLTIGQVVNGMASATTISATPSPGVSGQAITLTVQVGPVSGKVPSGIPAPTGTVTFQDNGSAVGTATLSATGATWSIGNPGVGTHQFTAIYSGDKFWSSSFGRVSDTVSAPAVALSNAAAPLSSGFSPDEAVSLFNISGLNGDTTSSLPLGASLAGVSVTIKDSTGVSRQALIYGVYASAGQINLVIPSGLAAGQATVTITLPGGTTVTSTITIANTAPAIYTAGMNGKGVFAGQIIYVQPDNSQNVVSSTNPLSFSSGGQVFLTLYGTGIRHYASGVTATVNGVSVPALAVAQGTYPGLDQINLGPLPSSLAGAGTVNIVISVDGQSANTVTVTIQ
jgi:hypothetical protein